MTKKTNLESIYGSGDIGPYGPPSDMKKRLDNIKPGIIPKAWVPGEWKAPGIDPANFHIVDEGDMGKKKFNYCGIEFVPSTFLPSKWLTAAESPLFSEIDPMKFVLRFRRPVGEFKDSTEVDLYCSKRNTNFRYKLDTIEESIMLALSYAKEFLENETKRLRDESDMRDKMARACSELLFINSV